MLQSELSTLVGGLVGEELRFFREEENNEEEFKKADSSHAGELGWAKAWGKGVKGVPRF